MEREYDTTQKQLQELELSAEAKKRREIQTLRRFGVTDGVGIRYSLPDIDAYTWMEPSSDQPEVTPSDEEDVTEMEEEESYRKKRAWKPLGWLSVSPLFRPRSRSDMTSRKYRAMSAGVVASTSSTTVQNLRRLYTGRSEFYDIEDEAPESLTFKRNTKHVSIDTAAVQLKSSDPINPKTLEEISRFENLIKNYFRKKLHSRY